MVVFYKKWKKYNEIHLTKKYGLEQSKNLKLSTLPSKSYINIIKNQYNKY